MGIGMVSNGNWYQKDINEYIGTNTVYTINFADTDICNGITGGNIEIGYWWGSTVPLYLETIEITYTPDAVVEETNTVYDYNNDGMVSTDDAEALKKYMVGVTVEGFEFTAESADVNSDGVVNVFDYMTLSKMV